MTARQLYVFAGPNGAGKSTFAATMVPQGTPIFDGDKKFAELKAFFYDLEESKIWTSINETHFPEWKDERIKGKGDVAFETNFRDPVVIESVKQFMKAGFESRLIFMGLDSVEASIERVELRVAKGGHNVSVEYININYEKSLLNLFEYYKSFTSVHLYQNFQPPGKNDDMMPLMSIINDEITEEITPLPNWASDFKKIIEIANQ
ncbi:hypothetical protein [Mucilaginibacter phyllosphaerae]|uniref:ABC-type ATPase n=1 Tax=Mucilaginibacter phyllosphaerae TaxID=1812349 RepID=A0A4Y8A9Y7_9SPHI|nr:hypothetical protein [Mucilaginibacter phyllosphaerae]MBB3969880.1 putative ABC-type ATPase [Mucilaginibacter phyllosphaerae]TEW65254.1 hypothetical protein E2R65_15185 [Mucilaginibacter phyllosphaerae]GGH17016.1 ATPase AAA [Mucilaginibacter phyllosphaerae]